MEAVTLLYEDADVVVVAKPAGMVVIPAPQEAREASLKHLLERQRGERLWVVHRLDRDTSGVVLLARHAQAHRALNMAFDRREVKKTYLAFTQGGPVADRGIIEVPLRPARKAKMRPAHADERDALSATTEYRVLRRWHLPTLESALVEVGARTGRRHQIRVHLRSIGAPLLVDPLYAHSERVTARDLGLPSDEVLCSRLTLHALRLEFFSPTAQKRISVEAPLPEDLRALEAALDRAAQRQSSQKVSDSYPKLQTPRAYTSVVISSPPQKEEKSVLSSGFPSAVMTLVEFRVV